MMVTSNLEVIIDQMENMIQELRVDGKGKIQLPKEGIMQLIEELRSSLPSEIKRFSDKTKELEESKQRILDEARERAQKVLMEANNEKERLLDNDERIVLAKQEAQKMLEEANMKAQAIIQEAQRQTSGIQAKAIKEYDDSLQFIIRYLNDLGKDTQNQMNEVLTNISIKLNEVVNARQNLQQSLQNSYNPQNIQNNFM